MKKKSIHDPTIHSSWSFNLLPPIAEELVKLELQVIFYHKFIYFVSLYNFKSEYVRRQFYVFVLR